MVPSRQEMRRLSDQAIRQRIDMNKSARYGLQDATAAQLNVVFIIAKRYDLDPLWDVTLYEGRPWITLDGWLKIIRRHPEYLGFDQWPLSEDEKVRGGWDADDIVWATRIRTRTWGEIVQWGKVLRSEVNDAVARAAANRRRAAPIGVHPVEICQKRSLARAARAAFGMDAPDEAEITEIIEAEMTERKDPQRVAALSRQYTEIFGSDDDADPPKRASQVVLGDDPDDESGDDDDGD